MMSAKKLSYESLGLILAAYILFFPFYILLVISTRNKVLQSICLVAAAIIFIMIMTSIFNKGRKIGLGRKNSKIIPGLLFIILFFSMFFPWLLISAFLPFIFNKTYSLDLKSQANSHILVTGSSGTGKSSLCKSIVKQLIGSGKTVMTMDIHGEYREYFDNAIDPTKVSLNLFDLDNESPQKKANEAIDILSVSIQFGRLQRYYLEQAIMECYKKRGIFDSTSKNPCPVLKDILEQLRLKMSYVSRKDKSSLTGLYMRLSSLASSGFMDTLTTISFSELSSQNSCIELNKLPQESQVLFIEIFLRKLYASMQSMKKSDLYVLIDEANKVLSVKEGSQSFVGKITAEGRKFGISVITSNQSILDLDKTIIANSATKIIFENREPDEFEYLVKMLSGTTDWSGRSRASGMLRSLRKFEFLLIATTEKLPLKLKSVKPKSNPTQKQTSLSSFPEHSYLSGLGGVTELDDYKKQFGDNIVAGLVSGKFLDLSGNLKEYIGLIEPYKSLEHSVYVRLISDSLKAQNIPHKILDDAGNPDIECYMSGKLVAIEYETGKKTDNSAIVKMIKKRLRKYSEVIVLVQPEQLQRYTKMLNTDKVKVKSAFETRKL